MRPSGSTDTRLLLAGLAASLALLAYLAVAFANTHASVPSAAATPTTPTDPFAPWTPKYHSVLAPASRAKGGGIAVHVSPGWVGAYGAVVPTLVSQPPPGSRAIVGVRLRGPGRAPIEVLVDAFPAGPDIIDTRVPATRTWRHYTFSGRIKGRWLGLGMYVGRSTNGIVSTWYAVRGLTVEVRR